MTSPRPAHDETRAVAERYARRAAESIAEQQRIEAADTLPFEAWRQAYLDPRTLRVA